MRRASLWMHVTHHDRQRLLRLARGRRMTFSALLREAVNDWLESEGEPVLREVGEHRVKRAPANLEQSV